MVMEESPDEYFGHPPPYNQFELMEFFKQTGVWIEGIEEKP